MKTQLICTFIRHHEIDLTVSKIHSNFKVIGDKAFLLRILDDTNELVLSYNVIMDGHKVFIPGSIMVHRKPETNTIYTINALNELIINMNNGILDKDYPVDWDLYRDMMLVKRIDGVRRLKIEKIKSYSV